MSRVEKNAPDIGKGAVGGPIIYAALKSECTTRGLVPFLNRHEFSLPDGF
jgi:hypothetical protein